MALCTIVREREKSETHFKLGKRIKQCLNNFTGEYRGLGGVLGGVSGGV